MQRTVALALAAAVVLLDPAAASAADLLKLTVGQRGNWDTSISHLGEKAGIFKKHGLELEIVYTSGSGETLQPVVAGSVDLGLAVGTLGAISAFAKSAPVRIVGAEATGAADYWYAKASSPIRTLQDTNGRTIAFSTQGSSTHSIVRAFIDEFKLTAKPTATGNPSATLTASEKTPGSGSTHSTQLRPASRVRRTPCARKPAYNVSASRGSTARHCAPLPASKRSPIHRSPASSRRTIPSPVAA